MQGVSAQGGVCQGGVSAWGCLPRGVCLEGCTPLPPWTEFLTHACGNITFPQLCLRTVIIRKHGLGNQRMDIAVLCIATVIVKTV